MKIKKIVKVLLSCALAGALFTGCGGDSAGGDKPGESKDIQLGMITHLNATESKMRDILKMCEEDSGVKLTHHVPKFYDSLKLMQMGIESGSVDQISLYKSVADYIIATNDKFEIVPNNALEKLTDNFCFAVRKDDAELKAELDKAIDAMKSDGTLDKLINDYITNVDKGQAPPAIEIPMTEGAQTIKVGVTGDLPPLDYVSADGKPAGFNTAILSEIAKRNGKNIELVQIESGARATALDSKIIDVVFWAIVPFGNDKIPVDLDKPEGIELSVPYFKDNVAHLQLKK